MNETGKLLLNALDKALEETKPDPAPLTSAFITELRRKHPPAAGGMGTGWTKRNWPDGLLFEGRMVEYSQLTIWAIGTDSGRQVCTSEVLEQLRNLQKRMDDINNEAAKYSLSNIPAYQHQQRDQLEADALAGKMPDGIVLHSRDAISEDFRAKQSALVKMLVKITHEEVVPLVKPILLDFENIVEEFLRSVEERERSVCEGFGIEYKPSVLWQAAVSLAMRLTAESRLPKTFSWAMPKTILDGILEI
jgi:hypothetical protein